jgi:hypothetical protein
MAFCADVTIAASYVHYWAWAKAKAGCRSDHQTNYPHPEDRHRKDVHAVKVFFLAWAIVIV